MAEDRIVLAREATAAGVRTDLIRSDYVKMIEEVKPDFVWAFVANNDHLSVVKTCASRGIHVIFEKPLSSSAKDSRAISEIARDSGIYVMTNYQMAWWPENHLAKQRALDGTVGPIWHIRGLVGNRGPKLDGVSSQYFIEWLTDPIRNGGGALMDFGCYSAVWALWYFGRPQAVFGSLQQLRPDRFPHVEDYAAVSLKYTDRIALFEASWNLPTTRQELEVSGEVGSVHMQRGDVQLHTLTDISSLVINPLEPPLGARFTTRGSDLPDLCCW